MRQVDEDLLEVEAIDVRRQRIRLAPGLVVITQLAEDPHVRAKLQVGVDQQPMQFVRVASRVAEP